MRHYELKYIVASSTWATSEASEAKTMDVLVPEKTLRQLTNKNDGRFLLFYCDDTQELYLPAESIVSLKQVYE